MAFPIKPFHESAILRGHENGKLPDSILISIPGLQGGPTVRLIEPAARSWIAMTAHALRDGIVLKASGAHDSYRPYSTQERIFRERYQTTPIPGRPRRKWRGQWWYQRRGTAAAAVPGMSNHGKACAVDTGTETDGDPGTESINQKALAWLRDHADEYGWSWELQSEPWHLRYYRGDSIPQAVLDFEANGGGVEVNEATFKRWFNEELRNVLDHSYGFDERLDGMEAKLAGIEDSLLKDRKVNKEDLIQELMNDGKTREQAVAFVQRVEKGQ